MLDAGTYYGILISVIFIGFMISLCISAARNRRGVKLYTLLLREDGRVSKVSLAFLFILPIIIYQAIYLNQITPGLDYILLTIFGTELGVKITDKIPNIINKRAIRQQYEQNNDSEDMSPNPYKEFSKKK